ncbi:hypothetical protein I5G24_15460 [Pseudomonas aeruginosa]|mgnify:CR=1 FL=1|uniref:hypothetical protein n=1 Tax=Pseudomonadaceae TaxID=135621 RepID=UPI00053DDF33|nr:MULTISPECIES: hypothetical protein [Pseudomonadaceae]SAJ30846.1 Uncharacterised protein [Enterobacter cloacae]ELQ8316625.1 hypothetical protein [Pseudomonas aeruginosa]MBG6795705.1 hypothetical protein [Pseudomonas aeruginosa]MBG6799206.1 hypothetical protein [Pseudomonas aeruginosa]MBI7168359.1 hypothetical protein [Pseudomonas aeruginosa]
MSAVQHINTVLSALGRRSGATQQWIIQPEVRPWFCMAAWVFLLSVSVTKHLKGAKGSYLLYVQ